MEQPRGFEGVTLAILFGDKIAVSCGRPIHGKPLWSLPQADRFGTESPAECALRLLKATIDLDIPVTRLNWPIIGSADGTGPGRWFFAAWITPAEWDVVTRNGGPQQTIMLGLPAFLTAETVPHAQKAALRSYLDQPRPELGRA